VIQNSRALLVDHHGVVGAMRLWCRPAAGILIVADLERADHECFAELLAEVIILSFPRHLRGADRLPNCS
jgi:hypothetical protein